MLRRLMLPLLPLFLLASVPVHAADTVPAAPGAPSEAAAVDAARTAAQSWLKLLDALDMKATWEQAASGFKRAVPQQTWEIKAAFVRDPLGVLRQRDEQAAAFSHALPGAPDGDYVSFQYQSVFEGKAKAEEKLTLVRDTDGQWRVTGYYVR